MNMSKKQGFTLVEIMITVVCAGIMTVTVALILVMGWFSWHANWDQVQLQSDSSLAVRMMSHQVRMSEPGNLSIAAGSLICAPNTPIRTYRIEFRKVDDTLRRYIDGTDNGLVIKSGLNSFTPQLQTNGVLLRMVMVSTNSFMPVAMTNQTFINTRNRP
jgi:type II secretory pathway pseudopilin PulG